MSRIHNSGYLSGKEDSTISRLLKKQNSQISTAHWKMVGHKGVRLSPLSGRRVAKQGDGWLSREMGG
jgi:hypothetical protein